MYPLHIVLCRVYRMFSRFSVEATAKTRICHGVHNIILYILFPIIVYTPIIIQYYIGMSQK